MASKSLKNPTGRLKHAHMGMFSFRIDSSSSRFDAIMINGIFLRAPIRLSIPKARLPPASALMFNMMSSGEFSGTAGAKSDEPKYLAASEDFLILIKRFVKWYFARIWAVCDSSAGSSVTNNILGSLFIGIC